MVYAIHLLDAITAMKARKPTHDALPLSPMDRRIRRPWLTAERMIAATVLTILLSAAAYGYVRYGLSRTLTVDSQRLTISPVAYKTFHDYIPVTGHVVPRATVYLDAVEGGQITEVFVEEGAIVEAGQPLVRMKNSALQLQVIASEAQLTEQLNYLAATRLTFEQNRLNRRRELLETDHQIEQIRRHLRQRQPLVGAGGVTQTEIEDLEAQLSYYQGLKQAVLEAQTVDREFQATQMTRMQEALEAMNANLDIARDNLDDLTLIAPISGQLTLLEAEVGESKAAGMRVGQIDQVNAFKVTALIDEFYLTRVIIGQRTSVDIAGQQYRLEVSKIYPGVRNRQFEVDLTFLDSPPASLRRGQTVRMRLEIGEPAESLVVANGPFYDDTGGLWAFVVDRSAARAQRRNIRFGRRNPEGIEVLQGLREGEEIVTSSYEFLMDFDELQLQAGRH